MVDAGKLVGFVAKGRDRFERGRAVEEPVIVRRREPDRASDRFRDPLVEHHQAVGITVRQRTQQHRIDNTEHCRCRTDRQRQRRNDRRTEEWRLAHPARRVTHILPEPAHHVITLRHVCSSKRRDAARSSRVPPGHDRRRREIDDGAEPGVDAACKPVPPTFSIEAGGKHDDHIVTVALTDAARKRADRSVL